MIVTAVSQSCNEKKDTVEPKRLDTDSDRGTQSTDHSAIKIAGEARLAGLDQREEGSERTPQSGTKKEEKKAKSAPHTPKTPSTESKGNPRKAPKMAQKQVNCNHCSHRLVTYAN